MQLHNMTALVADDMEAIRKILVKQLKGLGFGSALQVEDGLKALELVKEVRVDIIIADWTMPGMSGMALLKQLKSNDKWARIPFVMTTADAQRSEIAMAISEGVNDILIKPFTGKMFNDRVFAAIKAGGRARQVASIPAPQIANESNSRASEAQVQPAPSSEQNTILVVDDEETNRDLLEGLLEDDYQVLTCSNGHDAIKLCEHEPAPDLVLLDIMMPEISGFDVLTAMRKHPNSMRIPVIFISALQDVKYQREGLKGGAIEYLTKPIEPELLQLRVRNLLTVVNMHRDLQQSYDSMLELQRLKDDVTQILNKDLLGPLKDICDSSEALHSGNLGASEQSKQVETIRELSARLLNTVSVSTALIKIEREEYSLNPSTFSVHKMLASIRDLMKSQFESKRLYFYLEPSDDDPIVPLDAFGEEELSYSLFYNLMLNACEAAPDKTPISVTIEEASELMVTIRNRGAVPNEIRKDFWKKYTTMGKEASTGLGTYMAKCIAEVQNGSTEMQTSDMEDTTTVSVSLPRAPMQLDI